MDHNILLKKLYHYGIRGKANEWFCSYLSNRSQFVSINGFDSEAKTVSIGVPQSCLRTIAFSKDHHFARLTSMKGSLKQLKQSRSLVSLQD